MSTSTPRHRDNVRPADSYSLAVDPYRAPRHLDSTAWPVDAAAATVTDVA